MPPLTPAQPGPSASTEAFPPCHSVRPALQDWPVLQVRSGAPSSPAQQAPTALRQATAGRKTACPAPRGPSAPAGPPSLCYVHGEPPATVQVQGWRWPVCCALLVTTALSWALLLHSHVVLAASQVPAISGARSAQEENSATRQSWLAPWHVPPGTTAQPGAYCPSPAPWALFETPLGLPVWKTASCAALGVSVAEKAWLSPRGSAVLDITVGPVPIPPPPRHSPLVTSAPLAIFAQLAPRTPGKGPVQLAPGMQREGHRT
ncbi:PREDICTED: uncharacterized protein LOC109388008 [Hipposideros armiger]|uniref:Uncharacterized protein LOC109388008 n=1 Tax=Hipposideros armiger TaxID=186990 RepID=A0A8B7S4D0_HIPAR|nr:PREDICTED: uncharacterized protein LOC109388008 [Hipposideros armiger]